MKLTYFNIYGRAEMIRMLLHHQKIEYEEENIALEDWMKNKETFEFGTLPILEVDGVKMSQSMAIMRYLGRVYGFYPEDPEEAWRVDSLLDSQVDLITKLYGLKYEPDENRRASNILDFFSSFFPSWCVGIDKKLA